MELDKDKIFVVHYGSTPYAVFDNETEAAEYMKKISKGYEVLGWTVSNLDDFGSAAYNDGADSQYSSY